MSKKGGTVIGEEGKPVANPSWVNRQRKSQSKSKAAKKARRKNRRR